MSPGPPSRPVSVMTGVDDFMTAAPTIATTILDYHSIDYRSVGDSNTIVDYNSVADSATIPDYNSMVDTNTILGDNHTILDFDTTSSATISESGTCSSSDGYPAAYFGQVIPSVLFPPPSPQRSQILY